MPKQKAKSRKVSKKAVRRNPRNDHLAFACLIVVAAASAWLAVT